MGMDFRFRSSPDDLEPRERPARPIRLSGRVVGQLGMAEQLVVWAMREPAGDDAASLERLAKGFRLAFGLRLMGAAACSFDGLKRCFAAEPTLSPLLCPLHCACLGTDEQRLLHGLAAAQIGDRSMHDDRIGQFVPPVAASQLWRQSRLLATAMRAALLELPDARLAMLDQHGRPH